MSNDKAKTNVKQVKPYPLEGELTKDTAKITLSIMRVGIKGLVAHVLSGICQVGVHYECQFTLPTALLAVHAHTQVYKTYDGVDPKTHKPERIVELLFVKLPEEEQKKIRTFLTSIGQWE